MYTRQDRRRNKKKKQEKEKNKKFTHIHAHGRFMPSICTHMCVNSVCVDVCSPAYVCCFMFIYEMNDASSVKSNVKSHILTGNSFTRLRRTFGSVDAFTVQNKCMRLFGSYMWWAINAILCQEKLCLKSQLTTEKWKKYKCNDFDCNWIYMFFYFPHQFSQLIILRYWIWMVGIQS